MDWTRYQALCDSPDVCSRWLLLETLCLMEDGTLAARLRAGLAAAPLPKPSGHVGGAETDMLRPALTFEEVRAVRRRVEAARASGATTREGRNLGGFVEAWLEYEQWLAARRERAGSCSPGC